MNRLTPRNFLTGLGLYMHFRVSGNVKADTRVPSHGILTREPLGIFVFRHSSLPGGKVPTEDD